VDYNPPDWAKAKFHITIEEGKKMFKDKRVLFCDARAKAEYDQGHIPGAIPLPAGEFDKYYFKHFKRIKKAKKLVSYCHGIGCRLSEKTANALVEKGEKNVMVFFGGWPQWNEHKLPVESGDPFANDIPVMPTPVPTPVPVSSSPTASAMPVSPQAAPAAVSPEAK
jgi:predicted sulfurtransferase